MWSIVVLPLAGAVVNGLLAITSSRSVKVRFRPWVTLVGCLAPLFSLAACVALYFTLTGFDVGEPSVVTGPIFHWVASQNLVIDVGLNVDQLSLIMAILVTIIGSIVHIYSVGFMWRDAGYARYFAQLNLFLFFMLLLVLADNLVMMFAGWVGISLCSYLLIGFWFDDFRKSRAAMKGFITGCIGDVCFLAGIFIIFGVMTAGEVSAGSGAFNFETMERYAAYFLPVSTVVSLLLFAGAVGKSAQLPLHVWFPDAMAAPAPASALMHGAAMVTAGIYMIVRLNFIFVLSPVAMQVISFVGIATVLYAAVIALVENDLKRALAYSTISQLGYMFMAMGIGAFSSTVFHMVVFTFFNVLLFLSAGSVIHALGGERDIRKMGGLKDRMPVTAWTFFIAALALAGIFPVSGFFSRDAILWQAWERGHSCMWAFGFVGVGLSSFYIFRLVGSVFFGDTNVSVDRFKKITESPISMVVPLMLLATLTMFSGFLGIPEVMGGFDYLGVWLGQLVPDELSRAPAEVAGGMKIILMVVTVLWSAHFSILGWLIYAQKRDWPERIASRIGPLYKFVVNYYYVDKVFDLMLVRPLVWISRNILWRTLDRTVVDGVLIGGSSRIVGFMAALASATETGVLQRYLLYFLVGAVVVVGYLVL